MVRRAYPRLSVERFLILASAGPSFDGTCQMRITVALENVWFESVMERNCIAAVMSVEIGHGRRIGERWIGENRSLQF